MKTNYFIAILLLVLLGCSKDDSSSSSKSCSYVGGVWCLEIVPGTTDCSLLSIEFRSPKQVWFNGAYINDYKMKNGGCDTIEILNKFLGSVDSKAIVLSITGNTKGDKMKMIYAGQQNNFIHQ